MASLVDYLNSLSQPSDYTSRVALATSKGIQNYSGTAAQNTQLLTMLQAGGAPAPQPVVSKFTGSGASVTPMTQAQYTATRTPTPQPAGQPAPQGASPTTAQPQAAGGEQELINAMVAKGHTPETARAALQGRGYADLAREYLGATGAPGGAVAGMGMVQPTIDLPQIYQNLYTGSGVKDLEDQLSKMDKGYIEAKGKVNDNPFLSEATRVGRVAKLEQLYNERTANIRGDIATKKADIETQLNLQLKQFDINSQQAQQALNQFNSLLSAGALSGASGEDIAGITRATGISSTMIKAAVDRQTEKDKNIQLIQYDDGVTNGYVAVDANTGLIVEKQKISDSKSPAGGGTIGEREQTRVFSMVESDAKRGVVLGDLIRLYADSLTLSDILKIYNQANYYGPPTESIEELKKVYDEAQGSRAGRTP